MAGETELGQVSQEERIELVEDRIPLEGIGETAAELVELYGGTVESETESRMTFLLPQRRSVNASGAITCSISWETGMTGEGTVTLTADRESTTPPASHVAILVAGVFGAFLWTLWPFFPNLGAAAWVGAALAFASYFLTLRRTRPGIASDFLQRLAREQREGASQV